MAALVVLLLTSCSRNQETFEGSYILRDDEKVFLRVSADDSAITNANSARTAGMYRLDRSDMWEAYLRPLDRSDEKLPTFEITRTLYGIQLHEKHANSPINWEFVPEQQKKEAVAEQGG